VKIVADQLLTSSEVGELLQVNPSSVKKWVDDGRLLAFRTPGGHRRIRAADLVQFLDVHRMPIPRDLEPTARRRLLIVDDDAAQLKAFTRAFKRYGDRVETVTATNGIDALVLVGSFRPHFVLLDVLMPGIDGLEVCRRLKVNRETAGIGVVVITGHVTPALKRKALEAGALRVFEKPIDVESVVDLLVPSSSAGPMARAE
jgi:excisionase family DNA binding protein